MCHGIEIIICTHLVQWNLSIMVAHGPEINGCNREVAALKKCLVYGILPVGA